MNPSSSLIKIFAREFYRQNAGFFLLVIGISVGFLRDIEHIALAEFFISRTYLLSIPIIIWVTYTIKVIRFNEQALRKAENEICYLIPLLPFKNQVLITSLIAILQLSPVSLYGAFLIAISIKHSFYLATLITITILTSLHALVILILVRNAVHFNAQISISKFKTWFNNQGAKPYTIMILGWLIQTKGWILIGTKLLSCLLLLGISLYYKNETNGIKLIAIGTIFSFSSNIILLYHYHRFENYYFSLSRSLPISNVIRLTVFVLNILILSLTEIGILFTSTLPLESSVLLVLLGVSIMILNYGFLFIRDWPLDILIRRLFYMTLAFFLLVLFDVPISLLIALNILIGVGFRNHYQYRFEYKSVDY